MEDKRRLENRITQLEEDLEEEQTNAETATDKSRKALQQVQHTHTRVIIANENTFV